MNQKRKEKLDKQLSKGKWVYVLQYGVLFFGLFMAVSMAGLDLLFDGDSFWPNLQGNRFIYCPMGFFAGLIMWRVINKQYEKLSQASS